jgi:DNA ligase 1
MSKFPKPMLATNVENFSALKFPKLASPKLDGIRGTMHDGVVRSRSLKDIPNVNVQAKFKGLPNGLDGEFIVGSPSKDPYKRSHSVVMSDDKPADDVRWFVFDIQGTSSRYAARYAELVNMYGDGGSFENDGRVVVVPHLLIQNLDELAAFENTVLEQGYEGVMLNDPNAFYKHGRASENSAELLKVKRFKDAEAVVIDCECEYENQNLAVTNELGRTHRSSHQAGKVAKDTLGVLHCRSINGRFDTVQHDVAISSLTHAERKEVWERYKKGGVVGQILTYQYFEPGSDERPRHPIFKGWRDRRDM